MDFSHAGSLRFANDHRHEKERAVFARNDWKTFEANFGRAAISLSVSIWNGVAVD